jgi:HEPN domain-containing protein
LPRKSDSNDPSAWIWLAESDLEGVRLLTERNLSYPLCRSKLAEIVEKVLKAELLRMDWFLEKTHDLEKLAGELQARGSDLVSSARPLSIQLADAYFSERYPGFDWDDPDWPGLQDTLNQVSLLLQKVKSRLAIS